MFFIIPPPFSFSSSSKRCHKNPKDNLAESPSRSHSLFLLFLWQLLLSPLAVTNCASPIIFCLLVSIIFCQSEVCRANIARQSLGCIIELDKKPLFLHPPTPIPPITETISNRIEARTYEEKTIYDALFLGKHSLLQKCSEINLPLG